MKNFIKLTVITIMLFLVSCSNQDKNVILDNKQSIAFATYLSTSIINPNVDYETAMLDNEIETFSNDVEIAPFFTELENSFFMLKYFLNINIEEDFIVTDKESLYPDYEREISFMTNDELYTVYYNELSDNKFSGVVIKDEDEYYFEAEFESEIDETEYEITVSDKFGNTSVAIEVETDEDSQSFSVNKNSDDEEESQISFKYGNKTTKIELKVIDDNLNLDFIVNKTTDNINYNYLITYHLNDLEGKVEIKEVINDDGSIDYTFKVIENNITRKYEYRYDKSTL